MKAQSRPTLVVHEPLPNKTIWSFQGLKNYTQFLFYLKKFPSSVEFLSCLIKIKSQIHAEDTFTQISYLILKIFI
jgi:hypothetical protein